VREPSGGRRGGVVKEQVRQIVDGLPEDATWDDLMHEVARRADGDQRRERSRAEPLRKVGRRGSGWTR